LVRASDSEAGKIQGIGQSAGNCSNDAGSSETICGGPNKVRGFDFSCFYKLAGTGTPQAFIYWFVGMLEGDGAILVNSDGSLAVQVTQSTEDVQVLEYISNVLGIGRVSTQDKGNNTSRWRVRDRKGLALVIAILNGTLCTEKRRSEFIGFLSAYNRYYRESIPLVESTVLPGLNDAWLSGFTYAEGCFSVSVISRDSGWA
jgi:hypothetical protein